MPGNEYSESIIAGASKAAKDTDSNLYVFAHDLIDGFFADHERNKYRYQYNILSSLSSLEGIDNTIIEYGTICSKIDAEKKEKFLANFNNKTSILLSETADDYPSIIFDNSFGIKDAIIHIIKEHKKRKIAFFSGPKDNYDAQIRLHAYHEVMEEFGLEHGEDWIAYGDFSVYCHDVLIDLFNRHSDIEALICANDSMAYSAYDVMPEFGLKVGVDVLLTGFDDAPSSILYKPALTTVRASADKLSYTAIVELYKNGIINGNIAVPTNLIKRQSCGCENRLYYNESGLLLGSEVEREYQQVASQKIKIGDLGHSCLAELSYLTREVVFNDGYNNEWFINILISLRRIGVKRSYIFFYDTPIINKEGDQWSLPEYINLRAYMNNDSIEQFELGQRRVKSNSMLLLEELATDSRFDMFIVPLFYREEQFGLLFVDTSNENFQFVQSMASLISNNIQMANIQTENKQIQYSLKMANQAKSQFLANMSHEIRTPINAIIGMNEMIIRETQNKDIENYSNNIKNAAESLLSIVNDILDLTKIEANKMSLVPVSYNLGLILKSLMSQMHYRLGDKKLDLNLEVDGNLPSMLYGDDKRITQVLMNLLTNGIKYTEKGSVTLKVSGETIDDNVNLLFEVIDTGIGIKEEDLSKLFEKFERIEEKRNRNIEGTGLGLNIVASLLELMDSKLEVSSIYGKGSIFSFKLTQTIINKIPIKLYSSEPGFKKGQSQNTVRFSAKNARVLLVDDNKVNRMVIKQLLKRTDVQIDEADNGQTCLDLFDQNEYDLILLDHMMPILDGMETLKQIQEKPEYVKGIPPIIVLTANAIIGSEEEYLQAGFDAYLSKPVSPEKLDDILMKFLPSDKIEIY